MGAKHTPGTWSPSPRGGAVVSDQPLPGYNINGGHDHVGYYGDYLIAESIWREEDVRLIVAAPDLLEALKAARAYLSKCPPNAEDITGVEWGRVMDLTGAAINKAAGGQS